MNKKGKLILIPCPISEDGLDHLSTIVIHKCKQIKNFIVERERTTRRFLKSIDKSIEIDKLNFHEINKNNPSEGLIEFLSQLSDGQDIGLLSEAGCPGVADPGQLAVQWCHKNNHDVIPLVGPSSILLALMASGFNGQSFAFNGYLPNKAPQLIQKLKQLELKLNKTNQTQLFMDAPYRNQFLLSNCIQALSPNTLLCIASELNGENENISVKLISDWKDVDPEIYHKKPAIFAIGKFR